MEFESTPNQSILPASLDHRGRRNRYRRHCPSVSRSSSDSQFPERRPLVPRDVIGLIALDLILRIILAGMNGITFERDPGRDDYAAMVKS
jgi:hypothetical protein